MTTLVTMLTIWGAPLTQDLSKGPPLMDSVLPRLLKCATTMNVTCVSVASLCSFCAG